MLGTVYAIVLVLVGAQVLGALRNPQLGYAWRIAAKIRVRHVIGNLVAQAATIVTGMALVQLPVLRWGWWKSLGGRGNVLLGQVEGEASLGWISSIAAVAPAVLLILIAVVIPVLALVEEEAFRAGSEWRRPMQRVGRALLFGLCHAAMGIPLGIALALTLGGVWFTKCYLDGYRKHRIDGGSPNTARHAAITEAATHHIAWNWTLLVVVAGVMAL